MSKQQENCDVVLIGAPRSGTNMLRDVLASINNIGTWPCDEINYIWRHGNLGYTSDEFPAELATPQVKNYVRKQFESLRKAEGVKVVIEKTCANSLRVPFVNEVLPNAKFIYIYRDGIDTTGSAKLRWTAELDIPYLFKKLRYVPLLDIPYYGFKYFLSRLHRIFSKENRLAYWGPKLDNMDSVLEKHGLEEVCALQWQKCVENSENAFDALPAEKVFKVKYEDFVVSPQDNLKKILDFIGCEVSESDIKQAVSVVSAKSLGKGRKALDQDTVKHLESLVGSTLERYGYK